jgi:hypothetical protein
MAALADVFAPALYGYGQDRSREQYVIKSELSFKSDALSTDSNLLSKETGTSQSGENYLSLGALLPFQRAANETWICSVVVFDCSTAIPDLNVRNIRNDDVLQAIYRLDAHGMVRHAADRVLEHIDNLLNESRFSECDHLFREVDLTRLSDTLVVSFLGITLAAKPKLKLRAAFYDQALEVVSRRRGRDVAQRLLQRYR